MIVRYKTDRQTRITTHVAVAVLRALDFLGGCGRGQSTLAVLLLLLKLLLQCLLPAAAAQLQGPHGRQELAGEVLGAHARAQQPQVLPLGPQLQGPHVAVTIDGVP